MKAKIVSFVLVITVALAAVGCSTVRINPRLVYDVPLTLGDSETIVQTIEPFRFDGWTVEAVRFVENSTDRRTRSRVFATNGTLTVQLRSFTVQDKPSRKSLHWLSDQDFEYLISLPEYSGWTGQYMSKLGPRPDWVQDVNDVEGWQKLPSEIRHLAKQLTDVLNKARVASELRIPPSFVSSEKW